MFSRSSDQLRVVGAILAFVLLERLRPILRETLGLWQPLHLDTAALGATSIIALVTCLMFGLVPAVQGLSVLRALRILQWNEGKRSGSNYERL